TSSKAQYSYNEASSEVTTTFNVATTPKEGTQSGTIFALYPHQWKNSSQPLLGYTYNSVRGLMKTAEGASFQTKMKFTGVLPSLPDLGSYDKN
ncbi:glycoside hydrolase, partial [Paenibacillus sp. EKM208P]